MPASILIVGIDTSLTQLYMFFYSVCLIGCLFTGILLYQQSYLLFHNQTSFDRNKKSSNYDNDKMRNVQDSLGVRWYLTFFSPFVKSPLPHNGTMWNSINDAKVDTEKSK